MAKSPSSATIVFDNHITKVFSSNVEWEESGVTFEVGEGLKTFGVVLENGYQIDTVVSSTTSVTITNIGIKTFTTSEFPSMGLYATFTITSKASNSKKIINLSNLSKWQNLTNETHTINVIAKREGGYFNSKKSNYLYITKGTPQGDKNVNLGFVVDETASNWDKVPPCFLQYSIDNGQTWEYIINNSGKSKIILLTKKINNISTIKFKGFVGDENNIKIQMYIMPTEQTILFTSGAGIIETENFSLEKSWLIDFSVLLNT